MRYRKALIAHGLDRRLFETVTVELKAKTIPVKLGTLVDATLIASASEADGDGHRVKHKGRAAVHGFKAHVGVGADADTALVEKISVTPANVNDGRAGIAERGLRYIVGIQSSTSLWPPGRDPLPPKAWSGRGRPPSLVGRDAEHKPISAKQLASSLPKDAWRGVTWREGSNVALTSRFAAVRLRPAHRDYNRTSPRPEEWFLIKWPEAKAEPTKYWLSTLPASTGLRAMVNLAKLRRRIERDYQDLKQVEPQSGSIGFGQYEGLGLRVFHHHATLCIAAYGFLIAERGAFPPSTGSPPSPVKIPALPRDYRPRGAPHPT